MKYFFNCSKMPRDKTKIKPKNKNGNFKIYVRNRLGRNEALNSFEPDDKLIESASSLNGARSWIKNNGDITKCYKIYSCKQNEQVGLLIERLIYINANMGWQPAKKQLVYQSEYDKDIDRQNILPLKKQCSCGFVFKDKYI